MASCLEVTAQTVILNIMGCDATGITESGYHGLDDRGVNGEGRGRIKLGREMKMQPFVTMYHACTYIPSTENSLGQSEFLTGSKASCLFIE
jgi:hypothetical protein